METSGLTINEPPSVQTNIKTFGFPIKKPTPSQNVQQVMEKNVDLAADVGAQILRLPLNWMKISEDNDINWSNLTNDDWNKSYGFHYAFDYATANGLEVHCHLDIHMPPSSYDGWREFIEAALNRYPEINSWSLGNEVESKYHWFQSLDPSGLNYFPSALDAVSAYVELVKNTKMAFSNVSSNQELICSPFMGSTMLLYIDDTIDDYDDQYKYDVVDGILRADYGGYKYDKLDVHVYSHPDIALDVIQNWKDWRDDTGNGSVPWWVTETG